MSNDLNLVDVVRQLDRDAYTYRILPLVVDGGVGYRCQGSVMPFRAGLNVRRLRGTVPFAGHTSPSPETALRSGLDALRRAEQPDTVRPTGSAFGARPPVGP